MAILHSLIEIYYISSQLKLWSPKYLRKLELSAARSDNLAEQVS